jgi:hypothetical protein
MWPIARALERAGFAVHNVSYPSLSRAIEELAHVAVADWVGKQTTDRPLYAVTHSMGGIILRVYGDLAPTRRFARTVMLAPPNHGSEVADYLSSKSWYRSLFGPAGQQLTTGQGSFVSRLGTYHGELGIIAGSGSCHLWPAHVLPKPNDGRVSVHSTRVAGMDDFIELPVGHAFMMWQRDVIRQTIHFLRTGSFFR